MIRRLLAAYLAAALVVLSPGLEPWRLLAAGPAAFSAPVPAGGWAPALKTYFAGFPNASSVPSPSLRAFHSVDFTTRIGQAQARPLLVGLQSINADPAEFLAASSESQAVVLQQALEYQAASTGRTVAEIADALTPDDERMLERLLTRGPERALKPADFRSAVLGQDNNRYTFFPLARALQKVADSRLHPRERERVGQSLNNRFSRYVARLESHPKARDEDRASAAQRRELYLDSGLLWKTMSDVRKGKDEIIALKKQAARVFDSPTAKAHQQDWKIPDIPGASGWRAAATKAKFALKHAALMVQVPRVWLQRAAYKRMVLRDSPPGPDPEDAPGPGFEGMGAGLDYLLASIQKQKRALERIAEAPPLGRSWYRAAVGRRIRWIHETIVRVGTITAPYTFGGYWGPDKTEPEILHVPAHPALRLVERGGESIIQADFETDIQHDGVLEAAKASMESHWKGTFKVGGKRVRLRTEVTITRLAPGKKFTGKLLRLEDAGPDAIATAGADGYALGRNLDYSTPAHEFGHVLGLPDEYREWFVPETGQAAMWQRPGSLMGGRDGRVLERHLKTVYGMLRDGRYEPRKPSRFAHWPALAHRFLSVAAAAAFFTWTYYRAASAEVRKAAMAGHIHDIWDRINAYWLNDAITVPFVGMAAYFMSLLFISKSEAPSKRSLLLAMNLSGLVMSVYWVGTELSSKHGYDPIDVGLFAAGPALVWLLSRAVWWPRLAPYSGEAKNPYMLTVLALVAGASAALGVAMHAPVAIIIFGAALAILPPTVLYLETRGSGSAGPGKSGPTGR